MKSPAYTMQVKMKGKKTCSLRCGCCVVFNFKEAYFDRVAANETIDELDKFAITRDSDKRFEMISEQDHEYTRHDEYYYGTYLKKPP